MAQMSEEEQENTLYHEENTGALQPWQVLFRPAWRHWWRDSFPRKGTFIYSDRCTFEQFIKHLQVGITKENAAKQGVLEKDVPTFVFAQEQTDALRTLIDPWGSGLVSVEQINYVEQFMTEKLVDASLHDVVLHLLKYTPQKMPLNAARIDPGSLEDREKGIGDLAYRLTPGEKTKIAILFGIEGIGKSATAVRIVQALHEQLQFQKYTFFCDVRGCSTAQSLMCKIAHTMGYNFTGEHEPTSFLTWVRQYHIHDTLFVLDHVERTSTSFKALSDLINRMLAYTTRMRIIITTRSSGLKSALCSNGMSPRAVEEIALEPLTAAESKDTLMKLAKLSVEDLSRFQVSLVPGDLHFISNAILRGHFDLQADTRVITREVVLDHMLRTPVKKHVVLPWAQTDNSAKAILSILTIYPYYLDIQSVTYVLSSISSNEIDESVTEEILDDLASKSLLREITGRPYGKKYIIPDFVKMNIISNFQIAPTLGDAVREHYVRYFSKVLISAGSLAVSSDLSASYFLFDENYGNIVVVLFGTWSVQCFNNYYQIARKSYKILKSRLSPGDQIQFYEKVLDSVSPDFSKFENVLVAAYLNCRISGAFLALDEVNEAKSRAKTAMTALKARPAGGLNSTLEHVVQEYTALAIEREAEAYASPQLINKALEIKRVVYGEHPETCQTLYNLAKSFELSNEDDQALEIYRFALEMMKKVLDRHPLTALTMNNIGNYMKDSKEYIKALELYKASLAIRQETLGLRHPLVGQSFHNIAIVILDAPGDRTMAELKQAKIFSQNAVNILSMSYEAGNPGIQNAVELWESVTRVISSMTPGCTLCKRQFTLTFRRHRCRACGETVCEVCSPSRGFRPIPDMGHTTPVRVCFRCSTDLA